ncbi:hypothetical protein WALSEDRAFT_66641 [Wallemia mellicola CBS 633.66]|uniref:Uncharacterized protein n=1 Tax=Wallemia mellicola (strain ATCC MYA-4683 / CBS 633.66) TaxID=671144 RepID=I4Y5B3_WALMC|nr:hypothetical protein WALSEDRAFT_66641 [Wallemia mellicola CBS 633.66]EIM19155.1 hypothetical protein WALSEDRAFT_66641 [Wallemia mellicola CBS 633.66]|eukprot:XP_006960817.1 hypothetical protein WALSEDRAFT_66641 [Wallemia mellicola CBS 633.66]
MLFPTFPKILAGAVLPSLLLVILPWSSYVYASSEEHQTRQGDAETGITWPIPGLQNGVSPGMGAGMASLFMATLANQRAEGFCAKEQDGTRNSLEGCITANVAGVIFGVYGIYKIGGGFVTTRDNPPVLLLGSSGQTSEMVIHSTYSPPSQGKRREEEDLTLFDLDLKPGDIIMDYSFNGDRYLLLYGENNKGVPYVRPVTAASHLNSSARTRDSVPYYMDMYYVTWDRGNMDQFVYNPDAKGQLSSEIAAAFMRGDPNYPYYPYDYISSTVCLGIYDGPSKVSTAKLFVSDNSDLANDVDSVYSGIDPCWDYGYPYQF